MLVIAFAFTLMFAGTLLHLSKSKKMKASAKSEQTKCHEKHSDMDGLEDQIKAAEILLASKSKNVLMLLQAYFHVWKTVETAFCANLEVMRAAVNEEAYLMKVDKGIVLNAVTSSPVSQCFLIFRLKIKSFILSNNPVWRSEIPSSSDLEIHQWSKYSICFYCKSMLWFMELGLIFMKIVAV